MALFVILLLLFVAWVVVNLPRRRSDGELVTRLHPYRKMLAFMMDGRDDSVVFYDDYIKADALLEFIERRQPQHGIDMIHCLVGAATIALRENPKMNQFIAGKRLYARNHKAITFSMKRKKLDKEARLSAVKLTIPDDESIESLFRRINEKVAVERSDAETYTDREIDFMSRLPRPILSLCIRAARWADYHNLLPKGFIENDGFFTSMFIANLGSLGMAAAYHHLYNYGTCPLFLMVGKVEERPVVVDGKVVAQKTLHLRYSYDERIDDGLTSKYGMASMKAALENPEEHFKLPQPPAQPAPPPAPEQPPP
jgi:hypothetical protein